MPRTKPKPAPERAWPAASVEMRPIKSLLSYPRNARTHSPEQVGQIAASMTEFGWTVPVLVDEAGVIIAGHGRVLAANKLKFSQIPVMVAAGWTEAQKRAYRIADNQLGLTSEWDMEFLKIELKDLSLEGFNMELTGFEDMQLVSFISGAPTDPNAEWAGMPEFEQQNKQAFRTIPIHFKDQEAVDKFAKAIRQKITANTRFVWFPEIEIECYADKRYAGDKK